MQLSGAGFVMWFSGSLGFLGAIGGAFAPFAAFLPVLRALITGSM
jgi:hypothetical protein